MGTIIGMPVKLWVTTLDTTFAKNSKEDIVQALLNSGWKIAWKNVYKIYNATGTYLYLNGDWGNAVPLVTSKTGAQKLKIGGEVYYRYPVWIGHYVR